MSWILFAVLVGSPAVEMLVEAPTPVVAEEEAPTPLGMQVAELRADLAGKAAQIAALETKLAALESRCSCGKSGSVAVTGAREVEGDVVCVGGVYRQDSAPLNRVSANQGMQVADRPEVYPTKRGRFKGGRSKGGRCSAGGCG